MGQFGPQEAGGLKVGEYVFVSDILCLSDYLWKK